MKKPHGGIMKSIVTLLTLAALCLLPGSAGAEVALNKEAPAFTLTSMEGKKVSLKDYRGKTVVLEWLNHDCPFVKKHYNTGNMQTLQQEMTDDGVVWLSIVSSAPGKQGFLDQTAAQEITKEKKAHPSTVLLDPEGTVGKLYGAKTTPHMYIIDSKGLVQYVGAIDDKASTSTADVEGAKNYIRTNVARIKKGLPAEPAATSPYGCSVKYAG